MLGLKKLIRGYFIFNQNNNTISNNFKFENIFKLFVIISSIFSTRLDKIHNIYAPLMVDIMLCRKFVKFSTFHQLLIRLFIVQLRQQSTKMVSFSGYSYVGTFLVLVDYFSTQT